MNALYNDHSYEYIHIYIYIHIWLTSRLYLCIIWIWDKIDSLLPTETTGPPGVGMQQDLEALKQAWLGQTGVIFRMFSHQNKQVN